MPTEDVITGALLMWAIGIAAADWRWRRVPNLLLLALLLPTLTLLLLRGTGPLLVAWPASLAGAFIAASLSLPGYLARRLGAGDVKLVGMLGLLLGWPNIGWMLLCAALLLGLMSVATVAALGFAAARPLHLPAAVPIAAAFAATVITLKTGWL